MATLPAHPLGADVPDRLGPRLDPRPADRRRRHGARPGRRARRSASRLWWLGRGGRWLAWAPILAAVGGAAAAARSAEPRRGRAGGEPARRRAVQRGAARRSCARAGTPVFVYFTADWCLTCKVNERGALAQRRGGRGVPRTRHQGAGRRLDPRRRGDRPLPRAPGPLGRAALPLLRRRAASAEVLPQILTVGRLTAARRLTRRRSQTLRAADIGLQHLGPADLRAGRRSAKMSRSMKMKSAIRPGSSVPSRSSAKPA